MRFRTTPTLAMLAVALMASPNSVQSGEKAVFFNGKDFEGWEGRMEFWSVKDGVITGKTPDNHKFNTFLCSKQKYGDFELKFQVKMTKNGNSGVQIRSEIVDKKTFAVAGPQADMGGPYWGSLYGERFGGMMKAADATLVKKTVKEEDWNDYYIKTVGKHITIKLNGETMVDGDFPKAADTGIIAWQLHAGPSMEVSFRNIQFTPIMAATK
jgi:hypothetical protein